MTDLAFTPAGWAQKAREQSSQLRKLCAQVETVAVPTIRADTATTPESQRLRVRGARAAVAFNAGKLLGVSHQKRTQGLVGHRARLMPHRPADGAEAVLAMRELDQLKALDDGALYQQLLDSPRARQLVLSVAGEIEQQAIAQRVKPMISWADIADAGMTDRDPAAAAEIRDAEQALDELAITVGRVRGQVLAGEAFEFDGPIAGTVRDTVTATRRLFDDPAWQDDDPMHIADQTLFAEAVAAANAALPRPGGPLTV